MMDMFLTRWRRHGLAALALLALLIPATGQAQGTQEIIINEIHAANTTNAPLAEIPDYYPDYAELYNNSGRDIDLGAEGYEFTDDIRVTNKFRFPVGLIFPADSYMLVICDNESPTNAIFAGLDPFYNQHTGFNLDAKGGETLLLFKNPPGGFRTFVSSNGFGIQVGGYSVSRIPDANFNATFALTYPTPSGSTVPAQVNRPYTNFGNQFSLRINEWLATNTFSLDWVELFNPETNVIDLGGLVFTDTNTTRLNPTPQQPVPIRAIPNLSYISPTGFVRFWCSDLASKDADHLDFSLSSASDDPPGPPGTAYDMIFLFNRDRLTRIDGVSSTLWRARDISEGRLPDGADRITFFLNPSPEDSNVAAIPEVNINEILTHTDPPLEDAVEIHNVTNVNVDIGYWWLSNSKFDGKRYQIPPNTVIPPGGFHVIYESAFNNSNTALKPFTFNSARGDECYLFKGDSNGNLTGFRKGISFGPAPNGFSFGRHVTSDGNVEMVLKPDLSLGTDVRAGQNPNRIDEFRTGRGATNPYPLVGPVVINEIHYHPPDIPVAPGVTMDDSEHEFVELRNITSFSIPLYYVPRQGDDPSFITNGWKVEGIVEFDFPGGHSASAVTLAPGEYILLVNFDPVNTNAQFVIDWRNSFATPVPASTRLFGPYRRKLSNSGGRVELRFPDTPQVFPHPDAGLTPYVMVERVQYADASPWPTNTAGSFLRIDGGGASLQRRFSYEFGNDPTNWFGLLPTPGGYNSSSGLELPYFLESPQDFNGSPTTPVTFRVATRGTQPISLQWYFNGAPIVGATAPTHSIVAGSLTAGSYYAVATSPAGSSTSRVATVSVSCPFLLSRADASFGPDGGASNVVVVGTNGCAWSVVGVPAWVTLTSETNFDGNGTLTYTVAPHSGTTLRSARLTVAGLPYTILQSPPDLRKPTVRITAPASSVTTPNLLARGTASDNVGISRVEVQVGANGMTEATLNSTRRFWTNPVTLVAGTNWLHVRSYDVAGNTSAVVSKPVFYQVGSPITLATTGSGGITGARDQQLLFIGRNYPLTAKANSGFVFSNWTSSNFILGASSRLTVNMQPGLSVTANFVPNPFIPVKGVYNGLFFTLGQVWHTNSGAFKLTLRDAGTYSASIRVGGKAYAASGALDLEGNATNVINRAGLSPLTIFWRLGLNADNKDTVTGTVSTVDWVAQLDGDRAQFSTRANNPARIAGKYTLTISGAPDATDRPQGDSIGTVTVDGNGLVKLAGTLADGTKVSQAVHVSKYYEWPLYAELYSKRGSMLSWVGFLTNDIDTELIGSVSWVRPPGKTPKYYTNGFLETVPLIGSVYRAPAATGRILQLTNAQVTLTGGNLMAPEQPLVDPVELGLRSIVVNTLPNVLASLTVKFTTSSGRFSGTFIESSSTRRVAFSGVVLQKWNMGSGFFLGTNESGRVTFEAFSPPLP